ncbi:MAG: winged helix-turn-helix transcriptional regulator [Nitrospira sp.]|nr:winged helix-turn-helix transcriptional regulator [Nitrospira sp.]
MKSLAQSDREARSNVAQSPCHCAALRKAARRVSNFYDAHLKASGLKTTQFSLLGQLSLIQSPPPTMNELSEYLVMDRSTLGHNLRPLLRRRWVVLQPDAEDGRTRRVILTAKGAKKFADSKKYWLKAQQEYEEAVGKDAAVELRSAMSNLTRLDVS